MLENQKIFPEEGDDYDETLFLTNVSKIWRRIGRVYYHLLYHHWQDISEMEAEKYVLRCLQHWFVFCKEYKLVKEEEYTPIAHVLNHLTKKPDLSKVWEFFDDLATTSETKVPEMNTSMLTSSPSPRYPTFTKSS